MEFVKKLLTSRPGLMRTVLAVYVLAVVILHTLGLGAWASTLTGFVSWLGITPEAQGSPVSTEAIVAGALALVAVARPFLIWAFGEKGQPKDDKK